jgi:glucose dehydrogenase
MWWTALTCRGAAPPILVAAVWAAAACSNPPGSAGRPAGHPTTRAAASQPAIDTSASQRQGSSAVLASLAPDSGEAQWTIPAKNYASTRYSGLDQINAGNVARLQLAFTFSTGVVRGHEAAPLVVGRTMYLVTPFPNILYALDLSQPGAPLKWRFEPTPSSAAQGVACCDVVNRGAAYWEGRIYFNTLDAHTIAVDAETGREVWNTKLGEINQGESITMAPLVVKGKVLVGNSGGEFGVRGWLSALDARTGKLAWRAYTTGPDRDVLIGPRFKPFYPQDRGPDLGVSSWPGETGGPDARSRFLAGLGLAASGLFALGSWPSGSPRSPSIRVSDGSRAGGRPERR